MTGLARVREQEARPLWLPGLITVIGLAWAGFCMATLEAIQLYARRNAPQLLREEHPAPAPES